MYSPNIIIPFVGIHASIPSGWVRETTLDSKLPKGSGAENPNTTGGASSHTHTSPSHTHALSHHTHTGNTTSSGASQNNSSGTSDAQALRNSHYHTFTTDTTSGGTTNGTAVTYGSCSNDPPYYTVIFIKSTGYNFLPVNGLVLRESTTRTGLTFHSASAGKYLRGADTGNNAGSTGGSTTNSHSISHTHTPTDHTHTATTGIPNDNSTVERSISSPPILTGNTHTHTISLSGSQALNANSDTLVTSETVEPAYRTLNVFENQGASAVLAQVGDIAMWLGTVETIPIGWVLCDGTNSTPNMTDRFLKATASAGSSTTGGSNTHTHASQSHGHTSNGTHTHTGSVSAHQAWDRPTGGGINIPLASQNHSISTVSDSTGSYTNSNTTADSASNQPPYRTVAYIQMQFLAVGGSIINSFVG